MAPRLNDSEPTNATESNVGTPEKQLAAPHVAETGAAAIKRTFFTPDDWFVDEATLDPATVQEIREARLEARRAAADEAFFEASGIKRTAA